MVGREPRNQLRLGRRALEGLPGFSLKNDLTWHAEDQRWSIHFILDIEVPIGSPIPARTGWYVVVEDRYPAGLVKIYPAVDGGLTQTFPHQTYNRLWPGHPWRTGYICVTTPQAVLGQLAVQEEPRSAEGRLRWHVERATRWAAAVAEGWIRSADDPFEVPHFPIGSALSRAFGFAEDRDTLAPWRDVQARSGLVELHGYDLVDATRLIPSRYLSPDGTVVAEMKWGGELEESASGQAQLALWIRLDEPPRVGPWQVPITWGELRLALADQGENLEGLIGPLLGRFRDGAPHLLVVGFPIPEFVGGNPLQMHWQALLMPPLTTAATPAARGFRPNERFRRHRDFTTVLAHDTPIEWLESNNMSYHNAHSRGRLADPLVNMNVLVIGAGALGSPISDMLVRAGVKRLIVCDPQTLEHGNLARHTLSMHEEGSNKAEAVATRLRSVSAHVHVDVIDGSFPVLTKQAVDLAREADMVIDCTAEDDVLDGMAGFGWNKGTFIVHMAFGWLVRRLYVVGTDESAFDASLVRSLVAPEIEADNIANADVEMVREGVGCWHPLFPGRIDDVWMMASAGLKELERMAADKRRSPVGVVYEWAGTDAFSGVTRRVLSS